MQDHAVTVDVSAGAPRLSFAPVYNAAVGFIDRHLAAGRGDKLAIRTNHGEDVTYHALAERVARAGNALLDLGVRPSDRVMMIVKDCPAFFYLYWGAIKAGIVPVPVNTLLRAADYRYMIEDSGATALVYSPEFAAEVDAALAGAARKPARVLKADGDGSFAAHMARAATTLAPAATGPMDDCFWLYSSGSTGRPKGAVHRHRDIAHTAALYAVPTLGIGEADVCFSAAKLFFAYGLGNAMNFPLWVGATAVLSDERPSPEMTFAMIERFRPTIFYGVPTLYAAQLRALETATCDLASVRLCVSAGEALPADIFRRWKERTGLVILDGIGSTEGLHIFISNTRDHVRPGTSGRVVPGYSARIVDEAGREVADGEQGTLLVRGGSVAAYYWNNAEKTRATMIGDDWLVTGDTYMRDADGTYTYSGRSDDMIKVGGIWCSPIEIEGRLIEHAKVLEAAVVGRKDDDDLVKPAAFVILKRAGDAGEALRRELLEHCKSGLARYKYPRWITFVDELPKTATGKIQRFKLRD
ncbi:MAG: benzoate-CoA ligase family protein [Alphaproteobacteria bacterium]|nr:benzoate-CoA ligase family protein [Alphaproteobacteria bacterium]